MLQGQAADTTIALAAQTAMAEARPISDVHGSAEYRREMVRVLTGRTIRQALQLARTEQENSS